MQRSHQIRLKPSRCRVNPPAPPLPVCCIKCRGIVRHKICARARTAVFRGIYRRVSRPIAAQVNIGNNALVLEVRPNVTMRAGEVGQSLTPRAGVRRDGGVAHIVRDIGRDVAPWEEPHPDAGISQLHCVNTAAFGVKSLAVCVFGAQYTAAIILVGGVPAVLLQHRAGLFSLDLHVAVDGGVKSHLIAICSFIHGFHDVDLACLTSGLHPSNVRWFDLPLYGQLFGSDNQSAGQVLQPYGEFRISKMNRPDSYCFFDVIRTENRPVDAFLVVVSTRRTAASELA